MSSSKFKPQFTTATTIACSVFISLSFITSKNNNSSSINNNAHNTSATQCSANDEKNQEIMFYNYFPKNQLFQPKKPYPAWDDNWDGKEERRDGYDDDDDDDGVTRHILLVRLVFIFES